MTFTSLEYLLFLPIVLLFYFMLPHRFRWVLLLVASYVFYAYWNVSFLLLIIVSTVVDYWVGIKMGACEHKTKKKKYLYFSILVNIGMLFFFKYFSYCNEVFRDLLSVFDVNYPVRKFDILLPVGISFYTFQTLSYTIDVYKGDKTPEKHLGIFALYVSFFPQLVAGPIERSVQFLPQFYQKHAFNLKRILEGFKLILFGLFKKMVIADNLAIIVNQSFGTPEVYSSGALLIATLAFTLQLYCDFSAYSDIAIGSAELFGFKLMDNFKRPFFAPSISKFWLRWHISLTTWIWDYLYKPLLKWRKSKFGGYMALFIVYITIGAWHGAGGQFVLFGIIHAIFVTINRLLRQKIKGLKTWMSKIGAKSIFHLSSILITFSLVCFSGISFVSNSISDAVYIAQKVVLATPGEKQLFEWHNFYLANLIAVSIGLMFLFYIELTNQHDMRHPFVVIKNNVLRWGVYLFLIFSIVMFKANEYSAFYYFQF